MRFVDLSIPLTADVISDPAPMRPSITYTDHKVGALQLAAAFPGLAPEELPDGEGWAGAVLTLSTHNGTHVDAPWHSHSTSEGRRSDEHTSELQSLIRTSYAVSCLNNKLHTSTHSR